MLALVAEHRPLVRVKLAAIATIEPRVHSRDGAQAGTRPDAQNSTGVLEEEQPQDGYLAEALRRADHSMDDLSVAVVGGTYTEFFLRQLIALRTHLEKLEPDDGRAPLDISALVRIANSLDLLPGDIDKCIMALASIRNKYAHEVSYELTGHDVDKLRAVAGKAEGLRYLWLIYDKDVYPQIKLGYESRQLRLFVDVLITTLELLISPEGAGMRCKAGDHERCVDSRCGCECHDSVRRRSQS